MFVTTWIVGFGAGLYQAFQNAYSEQGLEHEVSAHDLSVEGGISSSSVGHSERLRKLEALRRDGLITQSEYDEKREDILDEDWGK